jgi:hypothetical protein
MTKAVIGEVQKKINRLRPPKRYTVRPVLIFAGELAFGIEEEDYFDRIINFDTLLSNPVIVF